MTITDPDTQPEPSGPRVGAAEVRDLAALRRSASDKKVAGVAGGIARHLDIDPLLVRVTLVVLIFFGGAGLIVYVACWLLVPLEGRSAATVRLDDRSRSVALVLVGVLATLSLLGDSLGGFDFPWALVALGTVVALLLFLRGRDDTGPAPDAPLESPAPRRGGPVLFWYALALITLGVGVLAILDLAGVAVAPSAYPALALGTSGVLLVLGSVWGRPGGLIALGLVAALATTGATVGSELDFGDVERTPTTSASLLDSYELDAGQITLDLTEISDLDNLDGRTLEVGVRLGRVEVVVPDGVEVTARTTLVGGDAVVFDVTHQDGEFLGLLTAPDGSPQLTLDVSVGLGEIEISHEGDS